MPGVSIDEAARLTGLSTTTIRRRIRSGEWVAEMVGGRWMIDPEQLGRRFPELENAGTPPPVEAVQPPVSPVPDDAMLVPLSAWQSMMDQLGNLHEAGQQLAEARERAGRAEEREAFAQERRQQEQERREALEAKVAELEARIAGVAPATKEPAPTPDLQRLDIVVEPPPAKEPAPEPEPAIAPTPAAEHLPDLDRGVVERLARLDRAYQGPKPWWRRVRIQRPGKNQ